MPAARPVLNAFTATELSQISRLSIHMVNYLRRMGFLAPSYDPGPGRRGRVRYYSYRDVVAARLVQTLREAGVELGVLKEAIAKLSADAVWEDAGSMPDQTLRLLHTDGVEVFVSDGDGYLDLMRKDRQRAFGFLVNLGSLAADVFESIEDPAKRANFSMQNRPLVFAERANKAIAINS